VKSVLVAYASKSGSTAEIAAAIAEALRDHGLDAECRPAGEVESLEPYGAVVLGSAVYMRRWQVDGRQFMRRHAGALMQRPFWVFSSGPVGDPARAPRPSWLEPTRTIDRATELGARGHVVFGGRIPAEPRGRIERAMARNTPPQYSDMRDWDEIRSWAARIAAELEVATTA
jgi:menaquinone-dependent protoporphyrinogen oxidase